MRALLLATALALAACPGGVHDHPQGEHPANLPDDHVTDVDGKSYPCQDPAAPLASGLELTFEDVAPEATAMVLLLDGPCLAAPVQARSGPNDPPLRVPLPSGSSYRLRGISIASEEGYFHVLDGGTTTGLSVPPQKFARVVFHVHRYRVLANPLNPKAMQEGHLGQLRFNVVNEGALLAPGTALLFSEGATPEAPLAVAGLFPVPVRGEPGADGFLFTGVFSAPGQPATLRHRLFVPILPGLDRAAFVTSPELALGEEQPTIDVTPSRGAVNVTFTGAPGATRKLLAAVDGPGLPQPVLATTSGATLRVGLPPGGPYRLRAVALSGTDQALSAASVVNLRIDAAEVPVSASLAPLSVTPDAANPQSVAAGGVVTLRFHASDPDNVLLPDGTALLLGETLDGNGARTATRVALSGVRSGASLDFAATFTAPAQAGSLRYQVAARALGLSFLPALTYSPDLAAGQPPLELTVR